MTENIGLVGYGSMGGEESFQKPYSDETNWEMDEEVRRIVKEQYALTKELLLEHKDKIQALGDFLLEHETINLRQIIDVLGDRPYGMNETVEKYLSEMKKRESDEADKLLEEEEDKLMAELEEKSDASDDENEDGDDKKKDETDAADVKLNSDLEADKK